MISSEELRGKAAAYGVPEDQILRDHLISHLLFALSTLDSPRVTFFGGTALCRTWARDTRLSEDVDLLVEDHVDASARLPALISRGIRREFPETRWIDLGRLHEVVTQELRTGEGIALKVQLTRWRPEWRRLPCVATQVRLRYSDLPESVILDVPTPASIVTMKLLAWSDRQAPRDLFDLDTLATGGYFTEEVRELFQAIAGYPPLETFRRGGLPRNVEDHWRSELCHQMDELPSARSCLETVRRALEAIALD